MRFWFDFEFIEDGRTIEPISLGIVAADGREYYAEFEGVDWSKANPWVRENVKPHLLGEGLMSRAQVARDIVAFVGPNPEWWGYYCMAPETKVLTADLRWVEAGSLVEGDRLTTFDENCRPGEGRSSRWRCWSKGVVQTCKTIERPCYDLSFEDGTIIRCSSDHKWLIKNGEGARWDSTDNIRIGWGVVKPLDTWKSDLSREAGYLAAAFDGEGFLTQKDLSGDLRGVYRTRIGFAQRSNPMLAEVITLLDLYGFTYRGLKRSRSDGVVNLLIANRDEVLRFLGQMRPLRLLSKFDPGWVGAMSMRAVKLVSKTPVGAQRVVAITTNTGTYVAEGFASHNCDYDWVCLCQLYGRMIDLPDTWPMFCMDIKQLAVEAGDPRLPEQTSVEHHALHDARWNRDAHLFLETYEW